MTDYTPTTADIEAEYGRIGNGPERRAAFHRWLAEHDRQVKAAALRDAALSGNFGTNAQSTMLAMSKGFDGE